MTVKHGNTPRITWRALGGDIGRMAREEPLPQLYHENCENLLLCTLKQDQKKPVAQEAFKAQCAVDSDDF